MCSLYWRRFSCLSCRFLPKDLSKLKDEVEMVKNLHFSRLTTFSSRERIKNIFLRNPNTIAVPLPLPYEMTAVKPHRMQLNWKHNKTNRVACLKENNQHVSKPGDSNDDMTIQLAAWEAVKKSKCFPKDKIKSEDS